MTREEAIRILASSCIPGSKQTEALETLIPELAESEDEWIRKFLVDFFASYKIGDAETKLNGVRIDDILAYLEKQKEQKSVDEQFPPLDGLDAIKAKYYDNGFKNGFDEGVASVKPAEWSEEDIKKIRSEEYTKGFNDAAFGGKLKDWSVEDEDRIRQIERIAQQAGCTQKLQEEIHDWLKSLRPSWKPSEVCYGPKGDPDPAGVWKPSKEQMEALSYAIQLLDDGISVKAAIAGEELESLREDLKKL